MARDDAGIWLLAGLGALLLFGGGAIVYSKTRGLRNNNPGNIVISNSDWQGKVSPNTDGHFEQFASPQYGIRALAHIIKTYQNSHGLNTVNGIIRRWSATDQDSYVANVANALGVSPNAQIDVNNPQTLAVIVDRIIHQENGVNPYPADVFNAGIAMV